jgi:predicted nucleotidyltransferase
MLKIINDLSPFFIDNYERIHVRDYAKIRKISPPTASKLLEILKENKLLKKEIDRRYYFFHANIDSLDFKDLQRIYYRKKLENLIRNIETNTINPLIFLFGSLSKTEAKKDSDVDIAIFTPTIKKINCEKYEKEIKRKIQLFQFRDLKEVPLELKNNILNGYKLRGEF